MTDKQEYSLFMQFLETYKQQGFKNITTTDPTLVELEKLMKKNNQFLYVADAINMSIVYTSKQCKELIGVEPEDISFYHFMEATHPEDIQRLSIGRTKLIKLSQDIFVAQEGSILLSTNFRIRNAEGEFSNFLVQIYMFYSEVPYKTVYFLKLHTKIDWCKKMKHGYHYYIGNDMDQFRYPNKELLNMGNILTNREFEIVRLVASGLSSEQIAAKLFLSLYTVNTHRGNILKKTGKAHLSELIFDFQERGLL